MVSQVDSIYVKQRKRLMIQLIILNIEQIKCIKCDIKIQKIRGFAGFSIANHTDIWYPIHELINTR